MESRRRLVCRTCRVVMDDLEPMDRRGMFMHPSQYSDGMSSSCQNVGKVYYAEEKNREVEPFVRKRERRGIKRVGKRRR